MDFWSRLVKGGSPSKKRGPPPNGPQLRLAQLKRAYNSLLQIWHNGDGVSDEPFVIENVCICLKRIAELLRDDQRGPTPHLCISFAATSRVLVTVARVSAAFRTEPIAKEALGICQLLIDSEEEAFLEDKGFVDTLPDFVESIQRLARQDEDNETEVTLVEVLFGITAKLRVESHLLRVWFRPEKPDEDEEDLTEDERRTRWEEFPLFYILLHYVPYEGRAGEFSRMALVYIVEMATVSSDLEKWLVEGDMAALMASGLGALYSQLSRKLAFNYAAGETPSILTFSEKQAAPAGPDAESTISESYQNHLGTFLSSLKFWQDLIQHCRSQDVKDTLLDHFEYLFLQQLLFPSLVESSDVDGGSSVAVLTYLKHILEYIDNPDLTRLTLQYLFGLSRSIDGSKTPATPLSRTRSRKSADLLTRLNDEDQPTPELFNLSALIFTSLGSKNQQTVTATLSILSVMLRGSHHQSLTSLLRTRPVLISDQKRTIGAHEKEIEGLLSLAEDLTGFQDLETSYEQHVQDSRSNLETHPCSIQLLNLPVTTKNTTDEKMPFSSKILILEDATFTNLIACLDNFFKNDIETNLGLSQVLIDVASCGYLRLELWLLSSPMAYEYPGQQDPVPQTNNQLLNGGFLEITPEQVDQMRHARIPPRIPSGSTSPVLQTLTRLTKTVSMFRRSITNFESHLLTCRGIIDRPSRYPTPLQTPSRSPSRFSTPYVTPLSKAVNLSNSTPIPVTVSSKIVTSNTPTRNASPRGRQDNVPLHLGTPPSLAARWGHLQLSPTRTPILQSSTNTPSRSPLRAGDSKLASSPVPLIPATLWQRIPVDKHVTAQAKRASESDASDSDSDSGTSSIGPGLDELSPTEAVATPSKSRHLVVPGTNKTGTRPRSNSSPQRRGRDGKITGDLRDDSENEGSDEESNHSAREPTGPRTEPQDDGTVSLGHLLTNVIILQEFILELAAVIEVRGALFEEVRYF